MSKRLCTHWCPMCRKKWGHVRSSRCAWRTAVYRLENGLYETNCDNCAEEAGHTCEFRYIYDEFDEWVQSIRIEHGK